MKWPIAMRPISAEDEQHGEDEDDKGEGEDDGGEGHSILQIPAMAAENLRCQPRVKAAKVPRKAAVAVRIEGHVSPGKMRRRR